LLLKHGYSVLMPDARAHGASPSKSSLRPTFPSC
jgi:alpha-beta hydrolase superfamily lysophospholipase